jgi:hypothetical protein
MAYLENHDKSGKVGPIGNKGFKINRVDIVEVHEKEPGPKGKHNPDEIGNNQCRGGKGGTGPPISGPVPDIKIS